MTLTIKQLSVTYRDDDHQLLALDQVDLALKPGNVTALVGESGSGKTTLGKALMGLLPDNARLTGRIDLDGRELAGLDEAAYNDIRWVRLAMLFQGGADNLNPVYRLVDQVAEPLIQHRGMERSRALAEAHAGLEAMGLPADLGRRYPHEVSGGQVQRALLAMALILGPEVVILDEPTAALDAMTKMFISDVIGRLRDRGKTILLITHDLELAQQLADTLAVLYLGQIMETMPARDLFAAPRHPYSLALGRSFPSMDAVRDLGGIRGDAFYRLVHAHTRENGSSSTHSHVAAPGSAHENGHAPSNGCLFEPRCTQSLDECRTRNVSLTEQDTHQVRCLRGGIVNILELNQVAKRYGDVLALAPTDLTLAAGEVFCLVGETGSGKTTLAGIAAGALWPDQGQRSFQDRDMDAWIKQDYSSLAPKIGFIYQNPAESVSHRFTVFDIVAEPLKIQSKGLSTKTLQTRVLAALADAKLSTAPEFLKRYPHELNQGAIQRLCLARSLVHNPELLVADEPTSALDPSVQAKILKLLLNLQIEKGLTMLFVTHDIGLARKISDRIGVMLAGRLVEVGPAARVTGRPGHPYTKLLIASALGRRAEQGTDLKAGETNGCPFYFRCTQRCDACRLDQPGPVDLDSGRHLAWCLNPVLAPGGTDETVHDLKM